ncbi:hypothetical protein MACJ_000473 [Theileria orientalis]|uniref:Protein kinase domain-containing protein n=1 Tax=Theileria orientalis TaxID=68886 RepID=A0A976M436_THEOR|nr:hypothetical protein MACJ_000473 [Theileria orientalis]
MSNFGEALVKRLLESGVKVTEKCVYWKPVLISYKLAKHAKDPEFSDKLPVGELVKVERNNIEHFLSGRAVNQYFIQKRIAETSTATLWRCYDVLTNKFYCIKLYYITACKKERSVRFFRDDTEVVTLLDKVIDEMMYHSSLNSCSGVCRAKEVMVDRTGDLIYFIMSYYPSQLMNYDYDTGRYCAPYQGELLTRYLYNEETAKEIMTQLVTTTEQLHAKGVVHKDIKPDNILISRVDVEMFDCFNAPENPTPRLYSSDDLMETTPYNEDAEELVEKIDLTKTSEIVKYSMEAVSKSLFSDPVTAGFPYNYSNQSDVMFTLWEDSKVIVDLNSFSPTLNEFFLGKNALAFARHAALNSLSNARDVYSYFMKHCSYLNYKINRNFQLSTVDPIASKDGRSSGANSANDVNGGNGQNSDKPPSRGRGRPPKIKIVENIVESDQKIQAVLSDFGVTSIAEEEMGELVIYDSEGTISFTSPESLKYIDGSISAPKREVFSLGVTLYCMIYGLLPYSGKNSIEMLVNILETPLVFHGFREVSDNLKLLLSEMLDKDQDKRIKLNSILSHPWFNKSP